MRGRFKLRYSEKRRCGVSEFENVIGGGRVRVQRRRPRRPPPSSPRPASFLLSVAPRSRPTTSTLPDIGHLHIRAAQFGDFFALIVWLLVRVTFTELALTTFQAPLRARTFVVSA